MNIFTEYEKTVIISLMKMLMEADAIIHPLEEEYLNSVLERIEVTSDSLCRYSPVDLQSCIICLKTMDDEKKVFVNKLMEEMSEADGYVDYRELELIHKISLKKHEQCFSTQSL